MNTFLQLVAVWTLSVVVHGQRYVLISLCGDVVTEGDSCTLNCHTGSSSETPIVWKRGAGVTFEVARATCENPTSLSTIPLDYNFTCPHTNYTLTIGSASVTRDKTTWACDALFGGKDSSINLDVQATTTIPTTSTTTTEPRSTEFTTTQNNTNDVSTSPPSGSPTPPSEPDGICKDNDLCYCFVLLPISLLILIGVLVWYRRRKKKESGQVDETNMTRKTKPNQSTVQQRL